MRRLKVTPRSNDYHVSYADDTRTWACGDTVTEAIGKFVLDFPDRVDVELDVQYTPLPDSRRIREAREIQRLRQEREFVPTSKIPTFTHYEAVLLLEALEAFIGKDGKEAPPAAESALDKLRAYSEYVARIKLAARQRNAEAE